MSLVLSLKLIRRTPKPSKADVVTTPNPDHAWKALSLINEWIRHSDTKAGVTLAFTGLLATMVFNLTKDFHHRTTLFDILVAVTGALLVATGALCGGTLTPRMRDITTPNPVNRLFFGSISKNFKGQRERYSTALCALTSDPVELTKDLADQIHVNAQIATTKARWVRWAIRTALAASASVASLTIMISF